MKTMTPSKEDILFKINVMTTEQFIQEQQDRHEIRGLVDAYAYCADRRNCEGQHLPSALTP